MTRVVSMITTRISWGDLRVVIPHVPLVAGPASKSPSRSDGIPASDIMHEYTINPARGVARLANQNWIVHTQNESHIGSKSGVECRWTFPLFPGGAMVHIGAICVRGANKVIAAAEWDLGFRRMKT